MCLIHPLRVAHFVALGRPYAQVQSKPPLMTMWSLAFVCLGVLGSVVKLLLAKLKGNGIAPIVIS